MKAYKEIRELAGSDVLELHVDWAFKYFERLAAGGLDEGQALTTAVNQITDLQSDFHTDKKDRLFYLCEGHNAWLPLDKDVSGYEQFNADLEDGETMDLKIKRVDMTDAAYTSMPDIS